MYFKRPETLSIPQIYHTFKAKDKNSENIIEYRIEDLPEERYEEALNLYFKHFLPDEPMCFSKGLTSPEGMKAFALFWIESFKRQFSFACIKNYGSDELVGVNCLVVNSKYDPKIEKDYQHEGVKDVFDAVGYTFDEADIYKRYNVDHYLAAYGLVVHSDYRSCGIATEILKARVSLLKKIGLSVTATAFSVIGSQAAAKKANFEDVYVISYEDFKKIDPRFDFTKTPAKIYKIMALKI